MGAQGSARRLWKVHRETQEVDLVIEVSPGRTYGFGEIRVVPEQFEVALRANAHRLGIVPGAAYRVGKLDELRRSFHAATLDVVRQESAQRDRIDLLFEVSP